MSEQFIVGMTNSAKTALEKIQRQQGRFREWMVDTSMEYGTAVGISLKVGTFRHAIKLNGRMRTYRSIALARQKLKADIRGAQFRRNARHKRNQVRHFGRGKVYHVFR